VLPDNDDERKRIPLWTATIGYFPAAFMLLAKLGYDANEQHNPGEPVHWARDKSTDHLNCAMRHLFDSLFLTREARLKVLTQVFWRIGAEIQTSYEELYGVEGNTTEFNAHTDNGVN